jgi:DNA primase
MDVPRLHPDTIEEVKQRVDIVEVISESVVMRKRGKDYVGACPFHDEKTPSFSVSPSKQLYYCFGCGAGGDAVKFLMELGKRSFSEVVLDLAQRYQIPIQTLEPEQRQEFQRQLSLREQLYEILAVTASFYQHALRQPEGAIALDYLKNKRQLSEETIGQFQLGYAPAGWETLYRYLVEQKRYPIALVEEAGLIKQRTSGSGYYDQFRDRLMIPIQDAQGRTIAFGSRTLGADEPKYLNSPETPLFDKGKTLFALDRAKKKIAQEDCAVLVEGYFDAIALHGAGITHAVASLGTALSQVQLKQLLRYTESKQIIFNFDADAAGTKATQRAIGEIEALVYSGQVQLRILNLPDGKDADEFLKSRSDAPAIYRQLLAEAPLWFDWQIQQLVRDADLKQATQFERVAQNMVKLLNQLEDSNKRAYYLRYCAEILSQGDSRLLPLYLNNLLGQLKRPQGQISAPKTPKASWQAPKLGHQSAEVTLSVSAEKSLLEEAEALLLRIYLHCPEHREAIMQILEEKDLALSTPHHRLLWQQIAALQTSDPSILTEPSNRFLFLLHDHCLAFPEPMAHLAHLFHLNEKTTEDIFRSPQRIQEAIAALERVAWDKYRRYCLQQWQHLDPAQEVERRQYYLQEFYSAQQHIQELDRLRLTSQ